MSMCSQMLLHLLPALRQAAGFDDVWARTLTLFSDVHSALGSDPVRRDTVSGILRNMVLILQSSGVFSGGVAQGRFLPMCQPSRLDPLNTLTCSGAGFHYHDRVYECVTSRLCTMPRG